MNGKTLAKLLSVALVAAAVFASGAFAHGGNNDPNAIHACVNRLGEVRILGFQGLGIDAPCPMLGGPWTNVHWGIVGPSGPSGASGPSGPKGATGATGPSGPSGPQGRLGLRGRQGRAAWSRRRLIPVRRISIAPRPAVWRERPSPRSRPARPAR